MSGHSTTTHTVCALASTFGAEQQRYGPIAHVCTTLRRGPSKLISATMALPPPRRVYMQLQKRDWRA